MFSTLSSGCQKIHFFRLPPLKIIYWYKQKQPNIPFFCFLRFFETCNVGNSVNPKSEWKSENKTRFLGCLTKIQRGTHVAKNTVTIEENGHRCPPFTATRVLLGKFVIHRRRTIPHVKTDDKRPLFSCENLQPFFSQPTLMNSLFLRPSCLRLLWRAGVFNTCRGARCGLGLGKKGAGGRHGAFFGDNFSSRELFLALSWGDITCYCCPRFWW